MPIQRRAEFLASLHARLLPGARVVFIDNTAIQCRDLPIAELDAQGNSYQHRRLPDGSVHRVLKNFPGEAELFACISDAGGRPRCFRELTHFWYCEYQI